MKYRLAYPIMIMCLIVSLPPLMVGTILVTHALRTNSILGYGFGTEYMINGVTKPPTVLISTSVYDLMVREYGNDVAAREAIKYVNNEALTYGVNIELSMETAYQPSNTSAKIIGYVSAGGSLIKYEIVAHSMTYTVNYEIIRKHGNVKVGILNRTRGSTYGPPSLVISFRDLSMNDSIVLNVTKVIITGNSSNEVGYGLLTDVSLVTYMKRGFYVMALGILGVTLACVVTAITTLFIIVAKSGKSILINNHA